jgi:hypothetical protein
VCEELRVAVSLVRCSIARQFAAALSSGVRVVSGVDGSDSGVNFGDGVILLLWRSVRDIER